MQADPVDQSERPASRFGPLARVDASRLHAAGILLPFVLLFITLSIASSAFLTKVNLLEILDQQSSTLVVAAAGTLVLVTGGIDISVGAIYALAAVTSATVALHSGAGLAIAVGIGVGAAVGLVNGLIVTILRINAIITTLAMSFVVTGLATLVANGGLIVLFNDSSYGSFSQATFLGVRMSIWVMLIPVVLLGLVLSRAAVGRYMYAVGGNPQAARLAGVRVNEIRVLTFVLSGTAAGLAGVIDTSRVLSASASTDTTAFAFTVLAGIVVGGTSILGGDGAIWRSVVGVLFIALVGNGYILLGLNSLYQQITLGLLLIGAVSLDVWSRRRR
jgi:ribose transport system permease protein